MKRFFFLLAVLGSLMFSCKKDRNSETAPSGTKDYSVTFNVSTAITATTSPIASKAGLTAFSLRSANSVKANAVVPVSTNYLAIVFSDDNNNLIKRIDQASTDANFGMVTTTLTSNITHAYFIASNEKNIAIDPYLRIFSGPKSSEYYSKFIQVSSSLSSAQTQQIILQRAVSQITITLDKGVTAADSAGLGFKVIGVAGILICTTGYDLGFGYSSVGSPPSLSIDAHPTPAEVAQGKLTRTFYIWPSNPAVDGATLQLRYLVLNPPGGLSYFPYFFTICTNYYFAADTQYFFEGNVPGS